MPGFTATMTVKTTPIQQIFAGQDGNGPLQVLYTVGGGSNFALAFVNSVTTENYNNPAFKVNLGSGGQYNGGQLHDLPGQPPIDPGTGKGQDSYGCGLLVKGGENITIQLGNKGSLQLDITVYEFTPI